MKNINVFLFLVFSLQILSLNVYSQPLLLSWDGATINDSLLVLGSSTDNELVAELIVTNNTGSSMDIKVRRTEMQIVDGSINYFCWADNCYPPNISESIGYLSLAGGQSSLEGDFSGHYVPNNNYGDSYIEYEFFNMNNEDENVKVVVQFATITGINENVPIVKIYPNPATEHITINLSCIMNTVKLYDYTGSKIIEEVVNSSFYKMNTTYLCPGIYILRISTDKRVIVKQIIIK